MKLEAYIEDLAFTHVHELGYLAVTRTKAVKSNIYYLRDIADIDRRIYGHLLGLERFPVQAAAIAEKDWHDFADEAMLPALFHLALVKRDITQLLQLLAQLDTENASVRIALDFVLSWCNPKTLSFLTSQKTIAQSQLLQQQSVLKAMKRGVFSLEYLLSRYPSLLNKTLKSQLIRHLGNTKIIAAAPLLIENLSFLDNDYFWESTRALILLGSSPELSLLPLYNCDALSKIPLPVLEIITKVLPLPDNIRFTEAVQQSQHGLNTAIWLAGLSGYGHYLRWFIQLIVDDTHVQCCLNVLEMVFEANPVREEFLIDAETAAELENDYSNPVVDKEKLLTWKTQQIPVFNAGKRYIHGREMGNQSISVALVEGNQLCRYNATLEQALRCREQALVDITDLSFLQ